MITPNAAPSTPDLLPQGLARADQSITPPTPAARLINAVRTHVYRPVLRRAQQILGGILFLRPPIRLVDHPEMATSLTLLHAEETLDFGDPAHDAFLRSCQYIVDGKLPRAAIFVAELPHAILFPRFGLVLSRRWQPILESIFDLARFHNIRRLLRPRRVIRRTGLCASVHHIFAENHWHWTVDSLAQILSLERHTQGEALTLLMPDHLPPHQREHLALLLPPHFAVEYVPSDRWLQCERFLLPSYVSSRANAMLPAEYIQFLRERVFTGLKIAKPPHATGRYYLSRSRARHRRVLNEDAVLDLLKPLGFEPLWMEDLSFAEQVRLMRSAEAIVGPHGAGLGCILYGDNLHVCVLYPEAVPAGYFYTLARAAGHSHHQTNSHVLEDDDFLVDLDQLQRALSQMKLH